MTFYVHRSVQEGVQGRALVLLAGMSPCPG